MKKATFLSLIAFLLFAAQLVQAQQPELQYYRTLNRDGLNVFEPSKSMDQPEFTGVKVRIGGGFTQDFQHFTSTNKSDYVATSATKPLNKNLLYGYISDDTTQAVLSGFNLAMANFNVDVQIADGIRVCLENYMSARHHNEFWVKGGYIQIDKLPMFNSPEWFTKYFRVKIGHFQPNFGDMQFRRSDGGNTFYNPFTENLIVDAFATEIGGEVYAFPTENIMIMGGMTSGFINGNISTYSTIPNPTTGMVTKKSPSIFGKVAYDNTMDKLRFRLSASLYTNASSQRNTLLSGDRTGSHYFGVMEPATIGGLPISIGTSPSDPTKNAGPNFTSGRFNPSMANHITAIAIEPFIKFSGLELYGGYNIFKGSTYNEATNGEFNDRTWNQFYGELVFRFLANEQAYIGGRYIKTSGEYVGFTDNIGFDRMSFVAGWFPTQNLLLKAEYINQNYTGFPTTDYRNEGNFKGFMVEAAIGF